METGKLGVFHSLFEKFTDPVILIIDHILYTNVDFFLQKSLVEIDSYSGCLTCICVALCPQTVFPLLFVSHFGHFGSYYGDLEYPRILLGNLGP